MFSSDDHDSIEDRGGDRALVNLGELALQLRISWPTLVAWMKRWPDFPIVERGAKGRDYCFDIVAVFGFLKAKKAEEAAANATRDLVLAQLTFPFDDDEANVVNNAAAVSIKEKIEALKLRRLQREEAEQSGKLVVATDVSNVLAECFSKLNRALHVAVRQACRDHNLPDAVLRSVDLHISNAQRSFVRDAGAFLDHKDPPDGDDGDRIERG